MVVCPNCGEERLLEEIDYIDKKPVAWLCSVCSKVWRNPK